MQINVNLTILNQTVTKFKPHVDDGRNVVISILHFYTLSLKGLPGHLEIGSSIRLFVHNSVPLFRLQSAVYKV